MRVLIIGDMEGVAGITTWEQVDGGTTMFLEARVLYTEEMNAAVRGSIAAGATEVVVMDCHGAGNGWSFNSLVPDQLDPRCEFVVQSEWTDYTEFLEQGCDAALMVGQHARAGTPDGGLNHTVSSTHWRSVKFNGVEVGEVGINARAVRHLELPGAARHRRRGRLPRVDRAARQRLDHRGGQAEPGPLQRPP